MQDTVSWKGHSFTLFVFAGIVVLCSMFFVLGMLVGRTQGQRAADAPAGSARAKTAAAAAAPAEDGEERPVLKRDERVQKTEPLREPASRTAEAAPPSPQANGIYFQISAVTSEDKARKLLNDVRKQGFPAFILSPTPADANPLYRVQVGPYGNEAEAEIAKRRLENLKYTPMIKK